MKERGRVTLDWDRGGEEKIERNIVSFTVIPDFLASCHHDDIGDGDCAFVRNSLFDSINSMKRLAPIPCFGKKLSS